MHSGILNEQQSGGPRIGLPPPVLFEWMLRLPRPCSLKNPASAPRLKRRVPTQFAGCILLEFGTLSTTASAATFLRLSPSDTQVAKMAHHFDAMAPNISFQRTPRDKTARHL